MPETKEIHFFGPKGQLGWLDPYYPCSVKIDGKAYKSSEHYYQSRKALSEKDQDWIASAPDAGIAKERAHSLDEGRRIKDWNSIKVAVERRAFLEKFRQNPELQEKLLATGDATLCEDNVGDMFWGSEGENMVGRLLMEVREELRKGSRGHSSMRKIQK
jgi:ribA/ribD-fused uncharacterized protein